MTRAPIVPVLLILAGCATAGQAPPAPAPAPAPAAAALPPALHWARTSAEREAIFVQTYRLATARLERVAAGRPEGTWAVSVDADETVIDNSLYEKELAERGEEFTLESWTGWVGRRAAPPLPGAVAFLTRVKELGGYVAVVTNRDEIHCPDTEANFREHQIPFDVILCRPDPARGEKEPRWEAIEQGTAHPDLPPVDVVLWIGDNIQDFPDLTQELRHQPAGAFDAFGVRYFVLPNPVYGSWERNPEE